MTALMTGDADFALALQLQAQFDAENSIKIGGSGSDDDADITVLTTQPLFEQRDEPKWPTVSSQTVSRPGAHTSMSLIDPSWDLIDPNPDARALFIEFNKKYFWGKLCGVEVRWSPRMTS